MTVSSLPIADLRNKLESSELPEFVQEFAIALASHDLNMLGSGRRVQAIRKIMGGPGINGQGVNIFDVNYAIAALVQAEILYRKTTGNEVYTFKKPTKPSAAHCAYCHRWTKGCRLTRDHVIPKAQGGSDDASNIVWCCSDCNRSKGNKTPAEWALGILEFNQPRPKPMMRLPLLMRLKMALTGLVAIVVGGLR